MQEAQEFLEAAMLSSSTPDEAFQRFDVLASRHAEALRQLTKKVQDARLARDTDALKRAVIAYEEALEAYIPGDAFTSQSRSLLHTFARALSHPNCMDMDSPLGSNCGASTSTQLDACMNSSRASKGQELGCMPCLPL